MDGSSARYTYDATGEKLRAKYTMTSDSIIKTTDYCGNLIYEQGRPKMLLVDGGYVTFNDNDNANDSLSFGEGWGGASYHYYLTDHLGNNRVVVGENDSIEQVNHYYPYGGLMAESTGGDTQRYKYNGKELDRMHGLDWYDYGARWMNGLTFMTPDPKAWDYTDVSPYVYCMNNPIKFIDPTGMIWEDPKDAENLKSRIDNKIESINKDNTKLQAKIDKGGLSNKKLAKLRNRLAENNERINNLNQSKADIDLLGEDNNTYVLSNINGGEHHVRLGDDQKVYIETSSDALSIHEITHVRQSLVAGGLKFKNGNLLNTGTTSRGKAKIEIEAYKMQYSYDKSFPGYINSINDINIQSVGNIKKENGEFVYQEINTLYMNELKQKRNNKKWGF